MALGLARREGLVRSAAAGPGNVVVLFGASTGRDGIGGASVLASAELGDGGDGGEDRRPTVQVGDPFEEKKLLECSLELLDRGLLVALQDLGAAGLTSSASEMASKGEVGIDLDLARVPLREPGMEPFEIMISESQERMLCVVEPHNVEDVMGVCEKWEVNGAAIGTVTESGRMRVLRDGELVGDMPVRALVDECPLYDLFPQRPAEPLYPPAAATLAPDAPPRETLLALLRAPNIASRRPLFEQYDAIVQSRTVRRPEQADAAVLALPAGRRAGRMAFARAGEQIALVGGFAPSMAAGELEKLQGTPLTEGLPEIDIHAVAASQVAVREAVRSGAVSSAHDIAEGGLAVALAECCLAGAIGARVELPACASPIVALFGEGPGGFLLSGSAESLKALGEQTSVVAIGVVGGETLAIEVAGEAGKVSLEVRLEELSNAHSQGLKEFFS